MEIVETLTGTMVPSRRGNQTAPTINSRIASEAKFAVKPEVIADDWLARAVKRTRVRCLDALGRS